MLHNMDELPFVIAGLQARPEDRELLHRLSAASRMSRSTPGAAANRAAPSACGRRPSAGTATARAASATSSTRSNCAKQAFPQVKEFFFDDDTFTDDLPRAEAIARELGKLGVTWSCNAKANVPRETLKVLARQRPAAAAGRLRDPAISRSCTTSRRACGSTSRSSFTKDCHELGIKIHGTFILGLPGETKETIEETIRFATEINPHTIQVSLAAPYPGTFLYKQAKENGWLDTDNADLVDDNGIQIAPLHYPHLSHTEIFDSVEDFYRRFYFRAPKIAAIVGEMVRSPQMMKRRLREGVEFFQFLRATARSPSADRSRTCFDGWRLGCCVGRFM